MNDPRTTIEDFDPEGSAPPPGLGDAVSSGGLVSQEGGGDLSYVYILAVPPEVRPWAVKLRRQGLSLWQQTRTGKYAFCETAEGAPAEVSRFCSSIELAVLAALATQEELPPVERVLGRLMVLRESVEGKYRKEHPVGTRCHQLERLSEVSALVRTETSSVVEAPRGPVVGTFYDYVVVALSQLEEIEENEQTSN